MKKLKKSITIILIITLLAGTGLFNVLPITAFAEETDISKLTSEFSVDMSDPYNPIYYDANGNVVDMNTLYAELADQNSGYSVGSLPSSYDARSKNLITSVKNQGNYNTCWTFATMSCLESDAIKKGYYTKDNADFSEAHLAWFQKNPIDSNNKTSANDGFNYGTVFIDGDNNYGAFEVGGRDFSAITTLSRQGGISLEGDFPYNEVRPINESLYPDTERYDTGTNLYADSMIYFPNASNAKGVDIESEVKSWIVNHGSATIAYSHNFSKKYFNEETYAYYYPSSENYINGHEVSIIGWDDNFSRYNFNVACRPGKDGAWLIKNSWGTDWADNGFFWISYESLFKYYSGYSVNRNTGIKNTYTYNGVDADKFIVKVPSNWVTANVFEAKDNEKLSKVQFYTGQMDVDVEISIYKLEKNFAKVFTGPISGDLVSRMSKSYHNMGFHTVDLKDKVELTEGQLFSVVIQYNTSASSLIIYTENHMKSNYPFASQPEESWYGYEGNWIDTSKLSKGFGNNYINAITEESSGTSAPIEEKDGRISATSSNLTIEAGSSKIINFAISPLKLSNIKVDLRCTNQNVSTEIVPISIGGSEYAIVNNQGKICITGLKSGTSDVIIDLIDKESGEILDSTSVNVSVKSKPVGKISFSPSSLTVYKGATATLKVSLSPADGNYDLNAKSDNNNISVEFDGKIVNGKVNLIVSGIKPGTASIKITLKDLSSGTLLDTVNVPVSIKVKDTPQTPAPSISIKGYSSEINVSYKSTLAFNAKAENMPAGSKIRWKMDGQFVGNPATRFEVPTGTRSYTVQALIVHNKTVIAESKTVTVNMSTGFFAKFIAFFQGLFNSLPVYEDGIRIK